MVLDWSLPCSSIAVSRDSAITESGKYYHGGVTVGSIVLIDRGISESISRSLAKQCSRQYSGNIAEFVSGFCLRRPRYWLRIGSIALQYNSETIIRRQKSSVACFIETCGGSI